MQVIFWFILVLIVISGLVSYAADRIGHSFSKRKLSILGVRPKYVSTAVAIISGIIISLITFLILILSVADFRKMLFEYTKIKNDLSVAQKQREKTKKEQEIFEFRLKTLTTELRDLYDQKKGLATQLDSTKSNLETKQSLLSRKQSELQTADVHLKSTLNQNTKLLGQNNHLQSKNEHLIKLGVQLQSELDFKENIIKGLGEEGKEVWNKATKGKLLIQINTPLAYLLIPENTSPTNRRLLIQDTLHRLKNQLSNNKINLEQADDKTLDQYTNLVADSSVENIIVFTTDRNIFESEPVQLAAICIVNKTVFKSGEMLFNYEPSINQEKTSILNELIQALQKLRSDAIELGLLPDINTGDVGSISRDNLIEAIEKAMINPAQPKAIQIISGEDVKTNGNLNKLVIHVAN